MTPKQKREWIESLRPNHAAAVAGQIQQLCASGIATADEIEAAVDLSEVLVELLHGLMEARP